MLRGRGWRTRLSFQGMWRRLVSSETKEEARAGTIHKSKGAFLTDLIKRYTGQFGIELGLKVPL